MFRALALCVALVAVAAHAEDDDDLPALPTKAKPKPAAPRPKPRPAAPKVKPAPVVDDDLPPLPQAKGELLVRAGANAKGAKLFIDDREIGSLPQPGQALTVGEHTITVRRLGYSLFTKRIQISANKTLDVNAGLDASAAVVSVSSDVAGAQVYVNNRFAGSAPLTDLEVPAGNVEISVKKDGYRDGSQQVQLKAGREYPIEVKLGAPIASAIAVTDVPLVNDLSPHRSGDDLGVTDTQTVEESKPLYKQWWLWTAVAVVVAAGVGVGVGVGVHNQSSSPVALTRSSFTCQQSGKMCDGWINEPNAIVPLPH